jgi:hypothetical protein
MDNKQEETKEKICDILMEKKRYLDCKDFFTIKCKKCGSEDIGLMANHCDECGDYIDVCCNQCGLEYNYHDFKQMSDIEIKQLLNKGG